MKAAKKAILYIRVSTDEQAERGHSLANQEEKLRNYCAQNGIEVAGLYREDHSAKTFERPQFTKLLEGLKKNKGSANLLLFLKWDRFSRNAPDAYAMISVLKKLGVEPQAIEQPLNLEIPENKIMLAIYLTSGEVENDRRALNVIAGMRRAMKEGRWMNYAPKGYRNSRDEHNKPCIIPGKDAELVRWAFEQLATGQYHIAEVWKMVSKKGFRMSRNGFFYLVRNPVYIGKVFVPAYKDEPAVIVQGRHEPLISERLFYEVQDVLDGKKKVRIPARQNTLDEIALRGYLLCPRCNRVLTGSGSRGNGGTYYYYHCTGGCKERVKAPIVNEAFEKLLRKVSGNEKMLTTLELTMLSYCGNSSKEKERELARIEGELATLQKRLSNIQTLMMDGELEPSDYRAMKAKLEPQIATLEREKQRLGEEDNSNTRQIIEHGFEFLRNMPERFIGKSLEEKHRFLGSTFPQKMIFENGIVRTNEEHPILTLLAKPSKAFSASKKKAPDNSGALTNKVIPLGLEPSTYSLEGCRSIQMSYGTGRQM